MQGESPFGDAAVAPIAPVADPPTADPTPDPTANPDPGDFVDIPDNGDGTGDQEDPFIG